MIRKQKNFWLLASRKLFTAIDCYRFLFPVSHDHARNTDEMFVDSPNNIKAISKLF